MANENDITPPYDPFPRPLLPVTTHGSSRSRNYFEIKKLGEGAFGKVILCHKVDTRESVAVKKLKCKQEYTILVMKEISMLEHLRSLDPEKCRIVKFYESYQVSLQTFLVFEALDMSLYDYMKRRSFWPLPLDDIQSITQQLATAFSALRSIGVIHSDVKLDNVMLVDHFRKPLRVKLIDFGLAMRTSEAKQGSVHQALYWRSPEILLGLPFSEAIDMWSLGCLMADLFLGFPLFPGKSEHDVMRFIVDLLGKPANKLLSAGLRTKLFFKKRPFFICKQRWRLMTPEEVLKKKGVRLEDTRRYIFYSLDEMKELNCVGQGNPAAVDRTEYVNLLKQMLQMDASKRITPSEVLAHPFITMSNPDGSHHGSQNLEQTNAQVETDKSSSSPQAVVNKTTSCQEAVDDSAVELEVAVESDKVAALNEAAPSPDTTEVGAPAEPAVDSVAAITSVKQNSPAEAPVATQSRSATTSNNNMADVEQTHTTSGVSEPERQKKKKKNRIRRFFSRMMRAIFCVPKAQEVERAS